MIETCDIKWDRFENSGRISDYLDYRGVNFKTFSNVKGEERNAYNDSGDSDIVQRGRGK